MNINLQLAQEFNLKQNYADNIVSLIEEGNTIPFIARSARKCTAAATTRCCVILTTG